MGDNKDLEDMKTGEVADKAREAGVENVEQMNKGEMIDALGGGTNTEHGGGQSQKDPKPEGVSPEDYKDVPGNQT